MPNLIDTLAAALAASVIAALSVKAVSSMPAAGFALAIAPAIILA
ncbi:hypothetical protein QQS45_06170 [Alteriqipengyuania flavescens]|nr:hypothetical protein [Alteriqipengyuania flavescens]WJY19797.1 hypothetical protein QQW98_06165 [Alteriqipengyuania flavescens]WJY25739.1 hypothetical protein QQS45_06170 [Alteriqipengyuania flavescens]